MNNTLEFIGVNIKRTRQEKNMSLKEFSQLAFGNTHNATRISLIERNKKKNVEFDTIDKLLIACDVNLVEILSQ